MAAAGLIYFIVAFGIGGADSGMIRRSVGRRAASPPVEAALIERALARSINPPRTFARALKRPSTSHEEFPECPPSSRSSFPASSRPAICISATISAPSAASSRCRTATTASTASSTMHAITVWQDPGELMRATREVTAAFLAAGIDPKKHIVFNQSRVRAARRARLDLQLRGPHGLADADDAVQGKGRQGPRERLGRACSPIRR